LFLLKKKVLTKVKGQANNCAFLWKTCGKLGSPKRRDNSPGCPLARSAGGKVVPADDESAARRTGEKSGGGIGEGAESEGAGEAGAKGQ
jgi:hypothetical protein